MWGPVKTVPGGEGAVYSETQGMEEMLSQREVGGQTVVKVKAPLTQNS